MSSPDPAFEARQLSKRFGRFAALREIDLLLNPGEVLFLFGRNGAGKTTFLHTAATLMKPSSGDLFYGGRNASENPVSVRGRIGLVSHASYLYADLTVRENLELYASLYGLEDRDRTVTEALERADLVRRVDSPVRSLSRGMHQRLTIARALLHRPSLLLLDEPFTGLDLISADRFSRRILELRESDAAVILTTHDPEQGLEVADRVVILESGRIVYEGPGRQDATVFRKIFAEAVQGSKS